jgi:glycosyltransferase involved in cell wall biosynthesis
MTTSTEKKPRIAIHNLQSLPNLATFKIHNYVLDLIKKGHVEYLYFDEVGRLKDIRQKLAALNSIRKKYSWTELGLNKVKFLFTERALNKHVDILLNFNSTHSTQFTPAIKRFKGIKIFHLMDYFWYEPGSVKYERLQEYGVDYLMSYSSSDKHCPYFKKTFPNYLGKVIAVPFGYTDRFVSTIPFGKRENKCVALGSVNPFRPADANPSNYLETADFYSREKFLHKFRRMIVENLDTLKDQVDSMLPVFPKYKDFKYDIVQKFNDYKMFTCDETMFYFPTAKTYEGVASGCVMVCSDHSCFKEFGFMDGVNCITHRQFDIAHLKERIAEYQNKPKELEAIHRRGLEFVRNRLSHKAVADRLSEIYTSIFNDCQKTGIRIDISSYSFLQKV